MSALTHQHLTGRRAPVIKRPGAIAAPATHQSLDDQEVNMNDVTVKPTAKAIAAEAHQEAIQEWNRNIPDLPDDDALGGEDSELYVAFHGCYAHIDDALTPDPDLKPGANAPALAQAMRQATACWSAALAEDRGEAMSEAVRRWMERGLRLVRTEVEAAERHPDGLRFIMHSAMSELRAAARHTAEAAEAIGEHDYGEARRLAGIARGHLDGVEMWRDHIHERAAHQHDPAAPEQWATAAADLLAGRIDVNAELAKIEVKLPTPDMADVIKRRKAAIPEVQS